MAVIFSGGIRDGSVVATKAVKHNNQMTVVAWKKIEGAA